MKLRLKEVDCRIDLDTETWLGLPVDYNANTSR